MVLVPSSVYFLRSERDEIKIPLEAMSSIDAGELPRSDVAIAQRGAEAITFERDLFTVPFGRAYLEGFMASTPDEPAPELVINVKPEGFPVRRTVALGFIAGAAAAAGVGIFYGLQAAQKASTYRMSVIENRDDLQPMLNNVNSTALAANILYGVAGGMLGAAALLWFWPSD
jgi:hypothetical protein